MAIIPALGITIYSGLEQRNQARLHALEDAQRLAQEISKDHDHLIQNARQTLFTLSKISQVQEQDKDTCCKISADIITTREGNFIDFNKSTLDLFGYNKEEMMGLNMQNLYVHSGERSKFQQEIESTHKMLCFFAMLFLKIDTQEPLAKVL
jgi:PAS domain-containing protein